MVLIMKKFMVLLLLIALCVLLFSACDKNSTTNPVAGAWSFTVNGEVLSMVFSMDGKVSFGQPGKLLEGTYSFPGENQLTVTYHVPEDVINEYTFLRESENELTLTSDSGAVYYLTKA